MTKMITRQLSFPIEVPMPIMSELPGNNNDIYSIKFRHYYGSEWLVYPRASLLVTSVCAPLSKYAVRALLS